jgi:hypothetical protein
VDGATVATNNITWPAAIVSDEACLGLVYVNESTTPFQLLYDDVTIDLASGP